jgi:hypothetical protein
MKIGKKERTKIQLCMFLVAMMLNNKLLALLSLENLH